MSDNHQLKRRARRMALAPLLLALASSLATLSTLLPAAARAGERIVYLGDSMSLNDAGGMSEFSKTIHAFTNELPGVTLTAVIACGFNAYDWSLRAQHTACGYLRKFPDGRVSYSQNASVPGIDSIVAEFDPTMIILQGGTNIFASVRNTARPMANAEVVQSFQTMKSKMLGKGATPRKCLWITPPYTSSKSLAVQEALAIITEKVVGPECQVYRSLEVSMDFLREKNHGQLGLMGYHPFALYRPWSEWVKPVINEMIGAAR